MHSCQYLRLNCNQPAEPWSNNSCQSACLHFLTANSLMHRTELRLSQWNRHCVERSSSLCMPSFMKSSLASWRTRMTLRDTEMLSNQSRKFLLQLSGLFWSLCGSMLISLRGRSLPGFTDGRHASVSLNRPEPAGECGQCRLCLTAGRHAHRRSKSACRGRPVRRLPAERSVLCSQVTRSEQ